MKLFVLLALATVAFANHNSKPRGETKDVCYYCKANVQKLYGVLNNKKTQDDIVKYAGYFCGILQTPLKEDCAQVVEQFKAYAGLAWPMILKFLQNPVTVCTQINMCKGGDGRPVGLEEVIANVLEMVPDGTSRNQVKNRLLNMCALLPGSHQFSCQSLIRYSENQSTRMMMDGGPINLLIPCGKCEYYIQLFHASFSNEETAGMIKYGLLEACTKVNDTSAQKACANLMMNYFDEFWSILVAELNQGEAICQVVGCVVVPTTTAATTTKAATASTKRATTLGATTTAKTGTASTKSVTTVAGTTKASRNKK